jgi:hypothetical protein
MHQAIAAQDRVASRQQIAGDIGEMVFTADFSRGGASPQALDQHSHDVNAHKAHAEIGPVDPAGVAAGRIEQRNYRKLPEKPRQLGPQHGRRLHFRA